MLLRTYQLSHTAEMPWSFCWRIPTEKYRQNQPPRCFGSWQLVSSWSRPLILFSMFRGILKYNILFTLRYTWENINNYLITLWATKLTYSLTENISKREYLKLLKTKNNKSLELTRRCVALLEVKYEKRTFGITTALDIAWFYKCF